MKRRTFARWTGVSAMGLALQARALAAIRVGYFDKYAPFSQRSDSGAMSGVLIDGLDLVGNACGLSFEHSGYPWARTQAMVEHGELDAFCTVRTQARSVYAEFCTAPIVSINYGIFHRMDDARPLSVKSVQDLRPLRQGTYRGSGYSRENLEPDRMELDNDEESILRRIALGNLDSFVESEITTLRKVKELGLADKIRFTPAPFLPKADYCFGLRRGYPELAQIMARMETATQAARKSGALQALLLKYK